MKSALGRARSRMRPSWKNWTKSAPPTSILRAGWASAPGSSMTRPFLTAASGSSTMLARCGSLGPRGGHSYSLEGRHLASKMPFWPAPALEDKWSCWGGVESMNVQFGHRIWTILRKILIVLRSERKASGPNQRAQVYKSYYFQAQS